MMRHYRIYFLLIVLLTVILRFYNFSNRWGLAYDQAHDALVAREALLSGKLPLLGPFSSAGPFQTGGEWYWLLMIGTALNVQSVMSPWYLLAFLSVIFVVGMMILGKRLVDEKFALVVGLFSSISTAQIAQSVNLTNQTPQALCALGALFSSMAYIRNRKPLYLFLLGITVSTAASIHLQGVSLGLLIVCTLLFTGIPSVSGIVSLFIGLLLPIIPMLIDDSVNGYKNFQNMLYYYLYDQRRISYDMLGRRWLTYVFIFIPNEWGHIIGGNRLMGGAIFLLSFCYAAIRIMKKKLSKEWVVIYISSALMISLLRYVKTPLFSSYLVFLHPFIIIISTYLIWNILKHSKVLAFVLIGVIVFFSGIKSIQNIREAQNGTAFMVSLWKKQLIDKFPLEKFALYDHSYNTSGMSAPLSLFLDVDNRIDPNGRKIGLGIATISGQFNVPVIVGDEAGYQIVDLSASSSAELSKEKWIPMTRQSVYKATEEWR